MAISTTATSSPSTGYNNAAFWEKLWRLSGVNFVVFAVIAYFVFDGTHVRNLIAAVISGMAVLNLLWFVAALRTTLADTGQGGWGAAATTASSIVATFFLFVIALFLTGQNDLAWAGSVLSSFPRAMLIMAGTFGFWRSGRISNAGFGAGVAVVVLVLLGGTTWAAEGFWAPDGAYSRLVSPVLGLAWVLAASQVLLTRAPATRTGW